MAKGSPTATAPPETVDTPAVPTNGAAPAAADKLIDPNDETVDIAWRGIKVSIPKRRGRWDIDALVDFQDSKPLPGLRKLLGQAQWQRIKRVGPTGDDLDEFSSLAADVINENCVA